MICPICNKKTNAFKSHLESHGFSSIEMAYTQIFLEGNLPLCRCGKCNKTTKFVSWLKGFRPYLRGHNRSNYGNKQNALRRDNKNKRKIGGWSKGKTAKESPSLERASLNLRRTLQSKKTALRLQRIQNISLHQAKEKIELYAPNFRVIENLLDTPDLLHLTLECKICGNRQQKNILHALNNVCNTCDPMGAKSHIELYRMIRGLDPDAVISCDNIIPPDDIDIYMPSFMTALEYNGLYFHSELFKNRLYHAEKTRNCANLGINLLHIFEDEWRDKRQACINHIAMITNKKALNDMSQLEARPVNSQEKYQILEKNHLEGDTSTLYDLGLFMHDKIVAVVSLRKPRHRAYKNMIELCRFVNITDIKSSTLLSIFLDYIHDHVCKSTIYAVIDDRLGLCPIYEAAGFIKVNTLEPRFWWTDGHQRVSRHKLSHSDQHSLDNSLVKIWGCDASVLIKKALN